MMITDIFFIISSYLLGSVPFGLVLAKISGYGDIRKIGSGNIGATNVLRTGNKKLALATLFCDMLKGTIPVLFAQLYFQNNSNMVVLCGLAALLGHIFPVWLKFKGGKGVATFLGVLFGLNFFIGALAGITWLIVAFTTKYSSLSALISILLSSGYAYILTNDKFLSVIVLLMSLLVIYRHKTNIKRLLNGDEPKIGKKK